MEQISKTQGSKRRGVHAWLRLMCERVRLQDRERGSPVSATTTLARHPSKMFVGIVRLLNPYGKS